MHERVILINKYKDKNLLLVSPPNRIRRLKEKLPWKIAAPQALHSKASDQRRQATVLIMLLTARDRFRISKRKIQSNEEQLIPRTSMGKPVYPVQTCYLSLPRPHPNISTGIQPIITTTKIPVSIKTKLSTEMEVHHIPLVTS